jgi:hypothetical protein
VNGLERREATFAHERLCGGFAQSANVVEAEAKSERGGFRNFVSSLRDSGCILRIDPGLTSGANIFRPWRGCFVRVDKSWDVTFLILRTGMSRIARIIRS